MEVNRIDSAQSFKGLNITKVAHKHRGFVRADLGELKKLGEQYDIKMKSCFNEEEYYDGIRIIVKPLKKNLSFLQRLKRPKGESIFYTESRMSEYRKNTTVIGQTKEAIDNLRKKTLLKVLS